MKKFLKYAACLAMLVMVLALFTGCADKATGGGWFYDCAGDKCTFGFNAQRVEEGVYKGQFQFKDHGSGQKIHIDEMMIFLNLLNDVVLFGGTDKDEVGVAVAVTDMGEPGPGAGDAIAIWYDVDASSLFDVPDWVPDWAGVIDGGNIQLHEEKD